MLDVKLGQEVSFESDFAKASTYIRGIEGYLSHELQRCVETPNRYVLLVRWETLQSHTEGLSSDEENLQTG